MDCLALTNYFLVVWGFFSKWAPPSTVLMHSFCFTSRSAGISIFPTTTYATNKLWIPMSYCAVYQEWGTYMALFSLSLNFLSTRCFYPSCC